jgi:hypothetical protein
VPPSGRHPTARTPNRAHWPASGLRDSEQRAPRARQITATSTMNAGKKHVSREKFRVHYCAQMILRKTAFIGHRSRETLRGNGCGGRAARARAAAGTFSNRHSAVRSYIRAGAPRAWRQRPTKICASLQSSTDLHAVLTTLHARQCRAFVVRRRAFFLCIYDPLLDDLVQICLQLVLLRAAWDEAHLVEELEVVCCMWTDRNALPNGTVFLLGFPDVCPEHVLANDGVSEGS